MKRIGLSLKQRLDFELAEKSSASSAAFLIVAVLFYFMDFKGGLEKSFSDFIYLTVVILAIMRFLLSKKFLNSSEYEFEAINGIKWTIFLNAICWGTVFIPLREVIKSGETDGFLMLLAISGFCASSVITLSSSRPLAWFFQLSLLGPTTLGIWKDYYNGQVEVTPIGIFTTIFILYLFKQTNDSQKQMREKIGQEISLEKSYEDLKFSNQRLLEETAKSQHSSRLAAIGEMAGGIAHEINTPLSVMLSNLEFLESLFQSNRGQFDQTYEMRSAKVKTAIERISKIIKGLRSFALQNDRLPKEKTNLRIIIDETLDFCSEKMRQNGVQLRYEKIADLQVLCHSVQISQVLLNLINNSFYEVNLPEVKDKWIEIKTEIRNEHVIISVIDSGRGVPLEYQTKLFQPFFTSKGVGQGTGLGLSISKGIMKDHGGDLFFDPGSTHTKFDMILPL